MLQIPSWQRILIWALVALGLYFAMPNGFYSRVELHNDALQEIELTGETPQLIADRDGWPGILPATIVNLGLDLRGGAHLLAEVRVEDVYANRMDGLWPGVRDALREIRDQVGTIRRQDSEPSELRVRISQPENMSAALTAVRELAQPVVSLLGTGGGNNIDVTSDGDVIIVTLSEAERIATDNRTMQQSLEIIRRRVDEAGTREPTIQRQGERRILIQVPGIGSAQELKDLIGTTAKLTFQPVVNVTGDPEASPGARNELLPSVEDEGRYYIVEKSSPVTGDDLTNAQPAFDQNGRPSVTFQLNPTGARAFCRYSTDNVGQPFAIVLDSEVISAPTIQEPICGGSGQITGNFSVEGSTELAILLRAGALPAEMTFLEERTVGPELGQDSIDAGRIACLVAFAAVLVFMAISYGWFGIVANIALILNVGMIFGLLSAIGATLTLPGIAGIVLTIGMAVDANVLVFERIREELQTAKGPARAIELGYQKALSAILDANITTFITAVILFVMGSGPVRGFSITLGLGIITSVFTAIYLTRLILVMWFERRRPRQIKVDRFKLVPAGTNWNFFGLTRVTFGASLAAMVFALGLEATVGLNFGIDFRGGTTIRTESAQSVDVGAYRDAIAPLELGDVSITEVFDPTFDADQNVAMIRIEAQEGDEAVAARTVQQVQHVLAQEANSETRLTFLGDSLNFDIAQTHFAGLGGRADGENALVFAPGVAFAALAEAQTAAIDDALARVDSISISYSEITFPSVESVGPKVSGELIWGAVIAVVAAIGAVLFYIWLRFEWQFSLGAVAALVHDVVLTIGVFSLLQIQFDLAIIAALLTIVGYSLNDTVVVFDRVRENLIKYKKKPLKEVLNLSINETLSRTIMTSTTTLLALLALLALGGDVIRGFVFAMTWGVVVGTYSSVFVASNILLFLGTKRDWSKPDANQGNQFGAKE